MASATFGCRIPSCSASTAPPATTSPRPSQARTRGRGRAAAWTVRPSGDAETWSRGTTTHRTTYRNGRSASSRAKNNTTSPSGWPKVRKNPPNTSRYAAAAQTNPPAPKSARIRPTGQPYRSASPAATPPRSDGERGRTHTSPPGRGRARRGLQGGRRRASVGARVPRGGGERGQTLRRASGERLVEVEEDQVTAFVRDQGVGFSPTSVPADRRGIAESIEGRMERNGGLALVESSPGYRGSGRLGVWAPRPTSLIRGTATQCWC